MHFFPPFKFFLFSGIGKVWPLLERWPQKASEDLSQLKIQSSSFWCRLAENYEMVLRDKEEPWVCTVSCAHVLESLQLINSNYF